MIGRQSRGNVECPDGSIHLEFRKRSILEKKLWWSLAYRWKFKLQVWMGLFGELSALKAEKQSPESILRHYTIFSSKEGTSRKQCVTCKSSSSLPPPPQKKGVSKKEGVTNII